MYRQPQRTRARQKRLKRIRSSHPITGEQTWMGRPRTDKIIAAVVRGPYNEVAGLEYVERGLEYRCRQVRAVAVEGNDPLVARSCRPEVAK
jgi:hypothetical protein